MPSVQVVDFQNSSAPNNTSTVEPERRLIGAPEQNLQNMYSDSDQKLLSGMWSSGVGKWKVDYSQRHEFCYLVEGHIVLTNYDGEETEFRKGDAFVIPVGFNGSWEVLEPVTKYYVIQKVEQ